MSLDVLSWWMTKEKQWDGPALEVGQVWAMRGREIAIVRMGKHLAECRPCQDGKVVHKGRADLKTVRQIRAELAARHAKLKGRLNVDHRFL
jgi:hypothetical protein